MGSARRGSPTARARAVRSAPCSEPAGSALGDGLADALNATVQPRVVRCADARSAAARPAAHPPPPGRPKTADSTSAPLWWRSAAPRGVSGMFERAARRPQRLFRIERRERPRPGRRTASAARAAPRPVTGGAARRRAPPAPRRRRRPPAARRAAAAAPAERPSSSPSRLARIPIGPSTGPRPAPRRVRRCRAGRSAGRPRAAPRVRKPPRSIRSSTAASIGVRATSGSRPMWRKKTR